MGSITNCSVRTHTVRTVRIVRTHSTHNTHSVRTHAYARPYCAYARAYVPAYACVRTEQFVVEPNCVLLLCGVRLIHNLNCVMFVCIESAKNVKYEVWSLKFVICLVCSRMCSVCERAKGKSSFAARLICVMCRL